MASFIESIRTFFQERKGSRLILILLTALLLELVAALQYTYTRNLLIKEEERITRMELTMESEIILHTLEEAELSMFENEWSVKESLAHPDSLFGAVGRMIESNSNVAGACIAVLPDYYPEKGRLFEPYAHREEGRILVDQIAGPDHDYTLGPYFQQALREEKEFWSDPYDYGTDPVQQLITYSYPVRDRSGRLAAICGLDIDLTWLSDTLNVHPYYPSSFAPDRDLCGEPGDGPDRRPDRPGTPPGQLHRLPGSRQRGRGLSRLQGPAAGSGLDHRGGVLPG